MTYEQFIAKYKGKNVEWDGVSPNQCVDLVKAYLELCFSIPTGRGKAVWGNAKDYYLEFNNITPLKEKFTRIKNTPEFVPQKGDICVFDASKTNPYGHICIADTDSTTKYFYSYDQNYGKDKTVRRVKHTYANFLGVLRPKAVTKKKTGKVNVAALNVRTSPSLNASIVEVIKKDCEVTIINTVGEWTQIGNNRYVMSKFLTV